MAEIAHPRLMHDADTWTARLAITSPHGWRGSYLPYNHRHDVRTGPLSGGRHGLRIHPAIQKIIEADPISRKNAKRDDGGARSKNGKQNNSDVQRWVQKLRKHSSRHIGEQFDPEHRQQQ